MVFVNAAKTNRHVVYVMPRCLLWFVNFQTSFIRIFPLSQMHYFNLSQMKTKLNWFENFKPKKDLDHNIDQY